MKLNNNILTVDIKVQDKFRELLSNLSDGMPILNGVVLGDSDIEYTSIDQKNSRILNAPFNIPKIKYPLIYTGAAMGLEGKITCFTRFINLDSDGRSIVSSLYDYPTNSSFTQGTNPPLLNNGKDFDILTFNDEKSGYILYFQTLLLNYFDPETGLEQRFNEPLEITVTFAGSKTIPNGWEITIDKGERSMNINGKNINIYHNSMLLSKDVFAVAMGINNGEINIKGVYSNISKTIKFNI